MTRRISSLIFKLYKITGVLNLLEVLSQCVPALLASGAAVVAHLLPALADMLAGSTSADSRFLALKLICDTLLPLLLMETDEGDGPPNFSPHSSALANFTTSCTPTSKSRIVTTTTGESLERLLLDRLLPICPKLLADEDPIPLYVLKLLVRSLLY